MSNFDIELRVRINDKLERQLAFIMEKENDPIKASMIRRLIQEKYNELLETNSDFPKKAEGIITQEG